MLLCGAKPVIGVLVVIASLLINHVGAEETVRLKREEETVQVTIKGQPFATYHFGAKWPKPFFNPLKTSDGQEITRSLVSADSKDHPHHKGAWVSVDEVNEVDFWAEKGVIKNVGVELVKAAGDPAILRVTNHWLGGDQHPIIVESTEIAIYGNRLLAYDIRFYATNKLVYWHDTKEGLFGLRVADPLRETHGGQIVNSEGQKTSTECWGKEADWVDYSGKLGDKVHGVALFDHPLNFRRSRYHVRNYGLFTLSPFGTKAYTNGASPEDPLLLLPGSSVRLRYGLVIHDGDAEHGHVGDTYIDYLKKS